MMTASNGNSSEMDMLAQVLMSARSAAQGDSSDFSTWPRIVSRAGVDIQACIQLAATQAHHILGEAEGEELAEAIILAECAWCMRLIEPQLTGLLADTYPSLELWAESAERAVPDERCCELLEQYRDQNVLGAEFRLGIISVPLSRIELSHAAGLSRPSPLRIGTGERIVEEEPMAMLDDGHPTPRLISRFESRSGSLTVPGHGVLSAESQLDHWWGVRLILDGISGAGIDSVRLGTLTLRVHPDDSALWEASLSPLPLSSRLRLLALDISIRLNDGTHLLL